MKRHSYREQDIAFGQIMLTLRTALTLTQTGLANILGVSRISVADWEAGNKYPKSENLKRLIAYAIEHHAFPTGREAEEIRALWKAAHQKVQMDEQWLAALLGTPAAASTPLVLQSDHRFRPPEDKKPPLRLPSQTTQFIGRNTELNEIARILSEPSCRLLTLLGPGGVGKTRLALAVAASQAHRFRGGAAFVPLEAVNTSSQIIYAIGSALNFSFTGQIDPTATLIRYLREQNLLLILDNFEHLLESRDLVDTLLQQTPNIRILVTSQVRLNLRAEWLFDVVGLSLPPLEKISAEASLSTQDAISSAAVQLFIQRAVQVQPTFTPSETTLMSIVHICQQVSGNPLAIELAAAGVRNLSIVEIEKQIRANLDLLSTTLRDIPMRHRSLRAAFDYSWALLNEPERSLISRLAVFRGGCTAEAAQEITGAAFSLLRSLVDRSLLHQNNGFDTSAVQRFFLLEPTREYALEKLEAAGEIDRLRHEHGVYYLELAEALIAEWDSRGLDSALKQLDGEHDNMRAVLQWARDSERSTLGLQLAGALWRFWRRGGYINEARIWLDELLALDDGNTDTTALSARLRALNGAAWLATDQGDFERAAQLFEQAKMLRIALGESEDETILLINAALRARAGGDYERATALLEDSVTRQRTLIASESPISGTLGPALYCLALVLREQGNFATAETLFKEGIEFYRKIGDREGIAQGELGLSDIARDHGDVARLRSYGEPSLATLREFGTEWAIGFALNNLAIAASMEGDLPKAFAYSSEAVTLFRGLQNKGSLAEGLITLGQILTAQGETMAARETFIEALRFGWEVGPRLMVAGALESLAQATLRQGNATEAVRFIGAAAALRAQMKTPAYPVNLPVLEQALAAARTALGDEAFGVVWSAAQAQPLEQLLITIPKVISLDRAIVTSEVGAPTSHLDWGDAIRVPTFFGREWELNLLTEWVIEERCRVVNVLGQGGIGKSALAVNLMHQIAEHFDVVIWRSLRDLPSCDALLDNLLQTLVPQILSALPDRFEHRLGTLIQQMRSSRVLLVLDNLESVLEEGERSGWMRPGYEGFGRFLRQAAETAHQSCVLLTSREKPRDLVFLEGRQAPVRTLRLAQLGAKDCTKLLAEKGLTGSTRETGQLIEVYTGNPLALKIVAQTIADLFAGEIAAFLKQGEVIFGSIRELLGQQFARLSALEQSVFLWLAILREPATLDELLDVQVSSLSRVRLMEAIESLIHRSLIERGQQQASFTLQSVVMEYAISQIIADVTSEIEQGQMKRLIEHGLELAQIPDYVRRTQERLIVTPILVQLRARYLQPDELEEHLTGLLTRLSRMPYAAQGYASTNLVALLRVQQGNLRGANLSRLALRSSYLQGVEMQDASLAETMMRDCIFTETFDAMKAVALSSSGTYWAASSRRGEVWLWEASGLTLLRVWSAHWDIVPALAFSPDERFLATCGGWDNTIKLWEVSSGILVWTGRHTSHANGVAFSPHGNLLATSSNDATVRLWDAQNGRQVQILPHPNPVTSVTWNNDGHLLVSGDAEGYAYLWAIPERGQASILQILSGHSKWVEGLAFSPDGTTLATAGWDNTIKLWEVSTGHLKHILDARTEHVTRIAWSPDGHTLASGSRDRVIQLWDVDRNSSRIALDGHTAGVIGLGFTEDSNSLLSGSDDGTLRLWDVHTGQFLRVIQGHTGALDDVDWSPDGTWLASGGTDALVTIWNITSATPPRVLRGHRRFVNTVAWNPNGRILASSEWDANVRLWDPTSGVSLDILQLRDVIDNFFHSFVWSPDGKWLASGTYRFGVQIINRLTHQTPWSERPFSAWIHDVAWSPDGTRLAGGSDDGTVYIWDAVDGTLLQSLTGHSAIVNSVVWSPDSALLASGGGNRLGGEVFLWNPQTGERVASFTEHPVIVYGLSWGQSQNTVISGDAVGTLRWWDIQSGQCLWTREAHRGEVKALKRSPDGMTLASCGEDGAIMLWELDNGNYLRTLRRDRPYERLIITGIKGLNESQKAALRALGATEDAKAN